MDSRFFLNQKSLLFIFKCIPTHFIKAPAPFGGGIKSNDVISSLSGEGYLLNLVSLSFGSPVSDSAISKLIFEAKATEDKTNIYTLMLYVSGKNISSFGYLGERALLKSRGGGFDAYSITSVSGGSNFGS